MFIHSTLSKKHFLARQLVQLVRKISPAVASGKPQNGTKQYAPYKSPIHSIKINCITMFLVW